MKPIVLDALLVQAEPDCLRLVLGPFCLDFLQADLVEVEELAAPADLVPGSAIAARLTLQAGARLMRLSLADAYHARIWKRPLPFAFATRPDAIPADEDIMLEAERVFFTARGLTEVLS